MSTMVEQDKVRTFRSWSIFVSSSEVYVRWGIMVLRGGESKILDVVGLGVVSEVEALLSALLKNLDMVVSVGCTRQSSKLVMAGV